jgi:hypothetical protein
MNNYSMDQFIAPITIQETPKSVWKYLIVFLLGSVLFLLYMQYEPMPVTVHLASLAGVGIGVFPIAQWLASKRESFPMVELICLSFAVQYCTPVYLQPNQIALYSGIRSFEWDQHAKSLCIIAISIFLFFRSYKSALSFLRQSKTKFHINLIIDPARRSLFLILGLVLGILFKVTNLVIGIGVTESGRWIGEWQGPLSILTNVSTICVILLTVDYYSGRLIGGHWCFLLYGYIVINMILGLLTGSLEETIMPLVILIIVHWNIRRKIIYWPVICGILIFVSLQPLKFAYRELAWQYSTGNNLSLISKAEIWLDILTGEKSINSQEEEAPFEERLRKTLGRLDYFHQFALVYDLCPKIIPYEMGQSYSYLLYAWIPRFIWPAKPTAQQANIDFSIRYGIQSYEGTLTTMNGIGYLGEGYTNFGVFGAFSIMCILGILFALLQAIFTGPISDGGNAIYLSIMATCLNGIGSNFAGFVGGLIQLILINALIIKLFTIKR